MIKIKDLPLEYVNRYGHINVVTPSGKKVSLKEAYKKYGETHIKENDVPYLTDFLTNQQQLDNATKREVEIALADKNIHNNFNMTSPDEQGTSNAKKVIGPILKGAAVATGLSYLLPQIPTFLTSNLGKQLVEPILKGEIANETVKLLGYKNGWGEGMYHVFGGRDYDSLPWYSKLGLDFTNLGYYGPTTKILTPIDELGKQYINYTTNDIALTEKELAKKIDNIIKNTKLEPTQQTVNEIVLLPKTRTTTYIKPWKESWEPTTRLYRVTGTSGKFEPSRDGTKEYVGMWFTDSPTKPNKYALETWKRSNRTGEPNPLELQYIDIPNSQLEHFRASKIADLKQVEFEPEDFIIPLDYPRLKIPYPILLQKGMNQFKLLLTDLSKYTSHKPIKYNTATSVELEGRPQLYFEAVTDQEPGNISVHFKTDGRGSYGSLTAANKQALFTGLNEVIPEGSKVSTYGQVSPGGVHGLNRLAQENGYTQVGTRIVLDKIGNTLEIPIFLKPLNSHLLGEVSAGKYGEFYPKIESDDIKWIADEFSNIYETTPLTLYTTPILERISDDTIALGIGEFNLSDTTKAFTDIMKRRWNLYNYKFSDNDITPVSDSKFLSYVLGDGNRTFHTVDWIFDNIKNKKQILYTPTTDHHWGGFHIRENDSNWIRWDPRISHIPATIHETISHGTDPIVRNFVTDTKQPVLGKSTISTLQWNPETGNFETMPIEMPSLYELLSYPIDIFNSGKVVDTITGDVIKDSEARASNWEMIANLYNRIAKERKITPKEAFQIPDSEFHSYVDNLSNKDIADLLKTTNGYTMKYAELLNTDDQYAVNNYLRLWRQALKYAPSLIPVGLSQTNKPTSNQKGGKLIPRKQIHIK